VQRARHRIFYLGGIILGILSPVVFFLALEIVARLTWAAYTEWNLGYFSHFKYGRDFKFEFGQLRHQKADLMGVIGIEDVVYALTNKQNLKVSLSSLFSDINWTPNEKEIIDSLNQIIVKAENRRKFIGAYLRDFNWRNPEIEFLSNLEQRSEIQDKRLVRMMMEEMYPVYEKFQYSLYAKYNPINRLLYGRNAVMTLFPHETIISSDTWRGATGTMTMYVVGGSTAYCSGVSRSQCWTSFLQSELDEYRIDHQEFPKFKIVNLGIAGGTSEDSKRILFDLAYRQGGKLGMDYLLWYCGLNETYYFLEQKKYGAMLYGKWGLISSKSEKGTYPNFIEKLGLYLHQRSALVYLGFRIKERLTSLLLGEYRKEKDPAKEADISTFKKLDREEAIKMAAKINFRNFRQVKDLARRQSFMFSIPLPRDAEERRGHFDYEAKDKMFSSLRAYARQHDIPFLDVAPRVENERVEEVFTTDRVHLNAYGNFLLAEEIFNLILPHLIEDLSQGGED